MLKYFLSLSVMLLVAPFSIGQVVKFKSSNLPIIVINTNGQTIVDEPKITADMGIINNAGAINHLTDPFNNYNGKIGIEIRGSSSQIFPKKQYGIELDDISGNSIDASLLGMPKKDDWILFAAYDDKTLMRDALAYRLGRAQGRYASRARFCELVLNGVYQGVYVLLEKIKRDKNRLNISKIANTDISGDNLTGGYIIKIDKSTGSGGAGWASAYPPQNRSGNQTIFFQYDYPKDVDIVSEQMAYIKQYVDAFEKAISSDNFKDPVQGYAKYIDVDSFVDFFIMMEVTKNADGYRLSTFLYKDVDSKGGKLSMGPIWDFNEGFGNVDYCTQGNPEGFVKDFNLLCSTDSWLIPFWWNRLLNDVSFKNKLATRWTELRKGPFQTAPVLSYIDSVASVLSLDSAQQRNFIQWPIMGRYIWPNYYVGKNYNNEIGWLKDWVTQRMNWLDANLVTTTTAIEEHPSGFEIKTYPNPFSSTIIIECKIDKPGDVQFEVSNSLGVKMDRFTKNSVEAGSYQWDFTLNGPPGIYILRTQIGNEAVAYTKLIKN